MKFLTSQSRYTSHLFSIILEPAFKKFYIPNREYKIAVIKMLTEVRRAVTEESEFQLLGLIKIFKKYQKITKLKNKMIKLKI